MSQLKMVSRIRSVLGLSPSALNTSSFLLRYFPEMILTFPILLWLDVFFVFLALDGIYHLVSVNIQQRVWLGLFCYATNTLLTQRKKQPTHSL